MVKFDQMFIFEVSLPCGPHTPSVGVAALGFLWYGSSNPDPLKSFVTLVALAEEHKSDKLCTLYKGGLKSS